MEIMCHKCGKKGHFSQECQTKGEVGKIGEKDQVHATADEENNNDKGESLFVQPNSKCKRGVVKKLLVIGQPKHCESSS